MKIFKLFIASIILLTIILIPHNKITNAQNATNTATKSVRFLINPIFKELNDFPTLSDKNWTVLYDQKKVNYLYKYDYRENYSYFLTNYINEFIDTDTSKNFIISANPYRIEYIKDLEDAILVDIYTGFKSDRTALITFYAINLKTNEYAYVDSYTINSKNNVIVQYHKTRKIKNLSWKKFEENKMLNTTFKKIVTEFIPIKKSKFADLFYHYEITYSKEWINPFALDKFSHANKYIQRNHLIYESENKYAEMQMSLYPKDLEITYFSSYPADKQKEIAARNILFAVGALSKKFSVKSYTYEVIPFKTTTAFFVKAIVTDTTNNKDFYVYHAVFPTKEDKPADEKYVFLDLITSVDNGDNFYNEYLEIANSFKLF